MKQTVKFSQISYGQKFTYCYNGEELIRYKRDRARPSGTCGVGRLIGPNEECEIEIANVEITSGLGIGGVGSDDYNIHTEGDTLWTTLRDQVKPGEHFEPTGTTQGIYTPGERCARCGREGNWNPSAGETLCNRHWDEY